MTEIPAPRPAATSLWRDVHKGIRSGLTMLVVESGAVDPHDPEARRDLADLVAGVMDVMASHARAEDTVTSPVVDAHLPELGARIAASHEEFDAVVAGLLDRAEAFVDAEDPRAAAAALHLDLARYTGAYLEHIDFEERVVLPALEDAVGIDEVRRLEGEFIASVPPEEKLDGMVLMFPAMNVEDRVEVLAGIRAAAPPAWFEQVWAVVDEVLEPEEVEVLEDRLGL